MGAGFMWLVSIPLCFLLASDLVSAPPPNLQTWKTVAELLPVLPVLVALAAAVVARYRKSNALLIGAQGLLWCSVAVVLVAIPKAP
jgi:hypothetical protein